MNSISSIRLIPGHKPGALDDEPVHVVVVCFDDKDRAIRLEIADTGEWSPSRLILVSPPSSRMPAEDPIKVFEMDLPKMRIERRPSLVPHKPVSRRSWEEHYVSRSFDGKGSVGGVAELGESPVEFSRAFQSLAIVPPPPSFVFQGMNRTPINPPSS